MEIKQYLTIAQRWAWLLILGLVLGGGGAFIFSSFQEPVYQTSTRVQVMSAPSSSAGQYSLYSEQQLAQTYVQTIKSRPILDAVAERIGGSVFSAQVRTQNVASTQLIDIFVEDADPQRVAAIANTLVDVFIERNYEMQSKRFAESELSLESQISQVDTQIEALQTRSEAVSSAESQAAITKALVEIERLQTEILTLQTELDTLNAPAREPGAFSTPTPSPEIRSQINEKELSLKQLQSTYDLYQQIYTNLVVLGESRGLGEANAEQEQMQSTLALYRQIRANLLSSYEGIRLARLSSTSNIVAIEPALVPGRPIRPNPITNAGLGAAVGLMLAAAIVFLVEYLDDTIKSAEQTSAILGLPVIGYIAELEHGQDKAYVSENPRSPVSEAFRTLRTNLEFASVDKPIKTLLIVSAHPGEGKTTIATNLAVTMAQGGKRVLLIDADLRRPRVHHYLGLTNRVGLSNLFRDTISIDEVIRPWGDQGLGVITSGGVPPNPADLLASERMAAILEAAGKSMDVVIVDAPPFLVADASILASRVDGVLLVIRPGKTPVDAATTTLEQMKRAGANILGVVLNRIPRNRPNYYGGYRHYSGYYKGEYGYYDESSPVSGGSASYKGNGNGKNKNSWLGGLRKKQTDSERSVDEQQK
jgi:capsular exopolysaccharide synthesis family protein